MKEKVLSVLRSASPTTDFTSSDKLMDEGVIDSLALISIIASLNNEFNIEIGLEDIEPSNFNSIDSITALVGKYVK